MKELLKHLTVYTCASKLTGLPMRGYDGHTEDDTSRLKKGIRSNHNLQWHEAWYRALQKVGMLDIVREKIAYNGAPVNLHIDTMRDSLRQALHQEEHQKKNAQAAPQHHDHYMRYARSYQRLAEIYKILLQFEKEAEDELAKLPLKKNKLIDWKDIDAVQFFRYDVLTNSFVEIDHKVK